MFNILPSMLASAVTLFTVTVSAYDPGLKELVFSIRALVDKVILWR